MRDDNFPDPVSDPEAEGLPGTTDDDSTAYDDVDSGREADGRSPAALPSDVPLAVDRYGTTPEEQLDGESLEYKLDREVPDPSLRGEPARRSDTVPSPIAVESYDPTPVDAETDLVAPDTALDDAAFEDPAFEDPAFDDSDPGGVGEAATIDPATHSAVSLYDRPEWGTGADPPVGRNVEPDEGARTDDEKDMIGYDAGAAGGGASAEELAMHEVPER